MKQPNYHLTHVIDTQTVTPNMQRLTLQSDAFAGFPTECEGGYIKLLFDKAGSTDLSGLAEGERPVMRTYTIRRFMPDQQQIEVDMVRHQIEQADCGFAARWALNAQVGDTINIAGPGTIAPINRDADWFFMAADMTALPALSAKIKTLPRDAKGYAVVQLDAEEDAQPLDAPAGMEIIWLTTPTLAETVKAQPWLAGQVSVWCACEFESMRALRQYFRNDRDVEREFIYISSYWKNGVTEEGHKVIKREDAENNQ
ncbi:MULTISPECIES: siderophore-interacting protein [unclassified Salinivibrio]|uniref:siderophore-interacting protein n=1 Tax=unclassified Salinivibrio TaxID=2636825 RepID=UPI00128D3E40|nr:MULTISPECIES: siderophore-interacting protein [unclassified Salinivibrio]MPS30757.1 siderophore-interacting protein [Salinivibrio sp. VYel7]MPX92158.1 siderophore-interacting protein [Salinivibrio sp. VYel9]MPX97444.1 siderophore-interacting protein [Salinivibrio sp. VYel6]MPX98390.1 siderophore-interacting protein [Salinivibrio sp. VYel4]MPY01909.1 siderophore-interacting protein [Salinivibrio sp. VYel5]